MSNNIDQIYEKFGSNICLFPFTAGFYSLEVQPKPIIMPCSSTKVIDWEVQDSSILKTMNNNQWKTLRKTFINGSCHDTDICKTCSLAEQNNGDSPRKLNNQYFSEHLTANIIAQVENIISNDYEISQILSMDYCPSNLGNSVSMNIPGCKYNTCNPIDAAPMILGSLSSMNKVSAALSPSWAKIY